MSETGQGLLDAGKGGDEIVTGSEIANIWGNVLYNDLFTYFSYICRRGQTEIPLVHADACTHGG